jgi:hypothetical protein
MGGRYRIAKEGFVSRFVSVLQALRVDPPAAQNLIDQLLQRDPGLEAFREACRR